MSQEMAGNYHQSTERKLPHFPKLYLLGTAAIVYGLYINGATIFKGEERDNWDRPVEHTLMAGVWEVAGATTIILKKRHDNSVKKEQIRREKALLFAANNPEHGEFNNMEIWVDPSVPTIPPFLR